jgi:ribosome biogenesis GTPase
VQFSDKVYRLKPRYQGKHRGPIIKSQEQQGVVISRYGNRADIQAATGEQFSCHIRRSLTELVTGDEVIWQLNEAEDQDARAVILKILPRRSVLTRPIRYQGVKAVAANIDQVVIITSVEPPFSARIVDRYLVAVEQANIEAVLCVNKMDLISDDDPIRCVMPRYEQLGYTVLEVSANNDQSLAPLTMLLAGKTTVLVGQSGVGKSSIVNALLPGVDTAVSELSDNSGLGTHTTTTSRRYDLPMGGALIDSPGIREFGMDHLDPEHIAEGFREISALAENCKFRNCQHISEPGCAVKAAINTPELHPDRYESYLLLREEASQESG